MRAFMVDARMQLSLTEARERRSLTQAQLAELSGIHKTTIWRIELGRVRPSYDTVCALEDALRYRRGTLRLDAPESVSA